MTSCLVKPALYIVQKTGPRVKLAEPSLALADTESEQEEDTGDLRSSDIIYYFSLPSCWSGVSDVSLEIIWKCLTFISDEFYQHKLHFYIESLK